MKELIKILTQLRPDVDFINNKALVDDDVIDSFDIVSIIGQINEEFDIDINVEYILPENFNSAQAMLLLIERLQEAD